MGSGNQKKVKKSVLDRVGNIEAALQNLIEQINKSFSTLDQQVSMVRELIGAVVDVVGVEAVKEAVEASRVAAALAQTKAMTDARDAAVAALESGIANGEIVAADEIGPRSVIVGVEADAEGKEMAPGRAQLLFSGVKPEFQGQLLGKGVGTVLVTPAGGTFTVQGVYTFTEKALEPQPEPQQITEPTIEAQASEAAAFDQLVADATAN
jgi:hypothetical protein